MKPRSVLLASGLLLVSILAGCDVMKSISVPANAHWSHGETTVNGDITIGANAVVDGDLRTVNGNILAATGAHTDELVTVNGDIQLAQDAHSSALTTVNGSLDLAAKSLVNNNLTTVNGDIRTANGTQVGGITDVNGNIVLCGTKVDENVQFVNGTLLLGKNASVGGDIIAKKPEFNSSEMHDPVLVVAPHAVVIGSIRFERPGKLYVSDSAVIHGVEGVTPEKFSGATPSGVVLSSCPAD